MRAGNCFLRDEGLRSFEKVIPPEEYYLCLFEWIETEEGALLVDINLRFTVEDNPMHRRLKATKDTVMSKRIDNAATDGVALLEDTEYIVDNFAPRGALTWSPRYFDFAQYVTFV